MAAIAAIVILPILGILVLAEAKWVHKELPYLGETAVAADGTKEYHTVSDINLINQHGKPITLDDFDSILVWFSNWGPLTWFTCYTCNCLCCLF